MENISVLAKLNDVFRNTFSGGIVVVTREFNSLDENIKNKAVEKIRNFSSFNEGNDPFNEHDCAIVRLDDINKAFKFKIDYYDKENQNYAAENPENESTTLRVLTISTAFYI